MSRLGKKNWLYKMVPVEPVVEDPIDDTKWEDAIEAIEVRLEKIESEQLRFTDIINKLLQFYCSEANRASEACLQMYA